MKRFYKVAAVEAFEDGFGVMLDGRPMRTPRRAPIRVATKALAQALCEEWEAQGERIDPLSMPLTQLTNTAIDLTPTRRSETVAELVRYGETDLLCYRADRPRSLVERQDALWQPLLDWLCARHGIDLRAFGGVVPQPQAPQAIARLAQIVGACNDFELAALHMATTAAGSVAIGLATIEGAVTADRAADAAFVDETHQIEHWGAVAAAAARLSRGRADVALAWRFAALLRAGPGGRSLS